MLFSTGFLVAYMYGTLVFMVIGFIATEVK